jgi:hypothetical protein
MNTSQMAARAKAAIDSIPEGAPPRTKGGYYRSDTRAAVDEGGRPLVRLGTCRNLDPCNVGSLVHVDPGTKRCQQFWGSLSHQLEARGLKLAIIAYLDGDEDVYAFRPVRGDSDG